MLCIFLDFELEQLQHKQFPLGDQHYFWFWFGYMDKHGLYSEDNKGILMEDFFNI